MKKILFFWFVFAPVFAQSYNLKGLKSVKIEIHDDYNVLPAIYLIKLKYETEEMLHSAGVKIIENNPNGCLKFEILLNTSKEFAEPRVCLKLELIERVKIRNITTEAITYSESNLLNYPKHILGKETFDFFVYTMLKNFINLWLEQNH